MKILLIESDSAFAQELSGAIEARGIEARVTGDGKEAIELARADRPDVIVLCVELPRMSGYSVCNKLKKDADLKGIPLVLVSAEATPETFEQHRKLKTRAEGYLIKPFGGAELLDVVGGLVELPAIDVGGGGNALVDLAEQEVSLEPTEERSYAPPAGARGSRAPDEDEARLLDEVFDQITADGPGEVAPASGAAQAAQARPPATDVWAVDAHASSAVDAGLAPDLSRLEAEADEALAALSAQDLGGPGAELLDPEPAAPEAASAPLLAAKQQEILRLEARVTQLLAHVAKAEGELSVRGGESSKAGEQVRQLEVELQRERERTRKLEESSRAAAEGQARAAEAARKLEETLERTRQEARTAEERLSRLGAEAKGHSERAGGEEQARKAAESVAADASQRVARAEERAKAAAERVASLEERTRAAEARTHAAEERVHAAEERARKAEARTHESEDRAHAAEERAHQADDAREAAEARARAAERLTAVAEERQREETARATAAEARAAATEEEAAALKARLETEEETSARLRGDLESARSSAADLARTLEAAQAQISAHEAELAALRPELERLRVELAGVRAAADAERDATARKLSEAADRITLLEAQLVRSEEQTTRTGQRLRVEKKAREKARKALAIALQLLEDGAPATAPELAPTNGARREERS